MKVKYFNAKRLMCTEKPFNVNCLRSTLHDINVQFDNLMCLAINIKEKSIKIEELYETCSKV